jgi:hypothetical protein
MLMDVIWEQPYQPIFLDVHYLFLCAADTGRERERERERELGRLVMIGVR